MKHAWSSVQGAAVLLGTTAFFSISLHTSFAQTSNLVLSVVSVANNEPATSPPYPVARLLADVYTGIGSRFEKYIDVKTIVNYIAVLEKAPYHARTETDGNYNELRYSSTELAAYLRECVNELTFRPAKQGFVYGKLDTPWSLLYKENARIARDLPSDAFPVLECRLTDWSSGKYGPNGIIAVAFASAELLYLRNGKIVWKRLFPAGSPTSVPTANAISECPLSLQQFLWNEFRPETAESVKSGTANPVE